MQDTTTQAMTELALGLSMAFFSIMILALLSMHQPTISNPQPEPSQGINKLLVNHLVDVTAAPGPGSTQTLDDQTQVVFYFNGKLFDQSLQQLTIDLLDKNHQVIVAVEPNVSFLQVVKLKNRINHPQLSITTINEQWLHQLQHQQSEIIK